MARPVRWTFSAEDTDGICAAQQLGGAGALTINGAALDKASFQLGVRRARADAGIQRTVGLTSAANLSGVNFTIVGTDLLGNAVSEAIAGPNNNTVYTTALTGEYHLVTSITADAAVGSDVTAGFGRIGNTNWWKPNTYGDDFTIAAQINVTNTISIDLQQTMDDVNDESATITATDIASWAAVTADTVGAITTPYRFIRAQMNSGDGAATITLIQNG